MIQSKKAIINHANFPENGVRKIKKLTIQKTDIYRKWCIVNRQVLDARNLNQNILPIG
tara:strand:- start:589 stop:762 length:174 start_codon:yes stop_codon:yes gene_type:complete